MSNPFIDRRINGGNPNDVWSNTTTPFGQSYELNWRAFNLIGGTGANGEPKSAGQIAANGSNGSSMFANAPKVAGVSLPVLALGAAALWWMAKKKR